MCAKTHMCASPHKKNLGLVLPCVNDPFEIKAKTEPRYKARPGPVSLYLQSWILPDDHSRELKIFYFTVEQSKERREEEE